ncbi:exodeoxyribonuclease V subunit alpha [Vibrio sp. MA40-2]|uniref:exodeoxyribonuclease V subunit alpha n=1 Tax=Vibrio sp. MA40-2 TaxID=3391828 RepID=UPI0039A452CD
MLNKVEWLQETSGIRLLDVQFARFIASIEANSPNDVGFIAGLLSYELSKGHICIKLSDFNPAHILGLYGQTADILLAECAKVNWHQILTGASSIGDEIDSQQPLIFDGERLYLQRYWYYECFLADKLNNLAEPMPFSVEEKQTLAETLDRLFPTEADQVKEVNWQKVAVGVALSRKLSVISGGPGTGKTTTVVKLLSALIEQGLQKGQIPKIKLVAPTGKAAARLTESIGGAVDSLVNNEQTKLLMPTSASTIHRLLGAMPDHAEFRHNQTNPLHLDLLVVDEASMVDLPLMAKLLDALPKQARLILLGDKDQLASVEAGAVLGDICAFIDGGYSAKQASLLAELTGFDPAWLSAKASSSIQDSATSNRLSECLCLLRKSYRFNENSGIGVLAKAINQSDIPALISVLDSDYQDVIHHSLTTDSYREMIDFLVAEYSNYLTCVNKAIEDNSERITQHARKALFLFAQCRLLCAVREGKFGLSGLNQQIEAGLKQARLINTTDELWYLGRPIMITRNDHALGLFNGDIGITMLVTEIDKMGEQRRYLKVFFELPDGSVKAVLPSRIPEHDTAYAMTIHKSQGSEFPTTVMVLPNQYSKILSKELIYTGVTRAKNKLIVFADNQVMIKGAKTKTQRLSGLKSRLVKAT